MGIREYNKKKLILYVGFGVLVLLALALRYTLLNFKIIDYFLYTGHWYDYLKLHGFQGFRNDFSNYNLPYLYLLFITTLLPISKIVAIKGISIVFDFILSYGVFLVVKHFNAKHYLPHFAALITLFLPTVFLNSSMMGQCDSIYTAFIVFSFYFSLKRRFTLMWVMWAVAFAFKLQAVFFLPLLLIIGLRHRVWLKSLICLPVLVAFALPALVLGRSLSSILDIYTSQVGYFPNLTLYAPNFYQWIPPNHFFAILNRPGIILTAAIVLFIVLLVYYFNKYSDKQLLLAATLILLVVPFFLPQMHERYFYPAEIFVLIAAFTYRPVIWYVPLMQFVTLCAYTPVLFNAKPVLPLSIAAIFVLIIISHLTYHLFINDNDPRTPQKALNPRKT
jgi:Gpi18-like mannosyltransferase